MTREEAINYLYSSGMSSEQVNTVVEALEQEPCEDAISRAGILYHINLELSDLERFMPGAIREGKEDFYLGRKYIANLMKMIVTNAESVKPKTDLAKPKEISDLAKIKEIVDTWEIDSSSDNLSYDCMIKISAILTEKEG